MLYEEFVSEYTNFFTGKKEKDATFFPEGVMSKSSREIVRVSRNKRYAPGGIGSAIKYITYYLNRAGKGLDPEQRARIERAREILQKQNAKEKASEQSK